MEVDSEEFGQAVGRRHKMVDAEIQHEGYILCGVPRADAPLRCPRQGRCGGRP